MIISIIIFAWPLLLFLYKFWRFFTYVKINLPCGSFKVKRVFRYDMNVMTRIVSNEFFAGGTVPSDVMEALYRQYGPQSWQGGKNMFHTCCVGMYLWLKRRLRPNEWYKSHWV
jgi:hypothetical protein